MKHFIAVLLLLLGCSEPDAPAPPKVLPTYTIEYGVVRMVHSEPKVGRSFVLIGNEWYQVQTSSNWNDSAGKTAAIVRQSDGKEFLTIDGTTGLIDNERNPQSRFDD